MLHFIETFLKETDRDIVLDESIKRTVNKFSSKIATEIRPGYRSIITKFFKNGKDAIISLEKETASHRNGYLFLSFF